MANDDEPDEPGEFTRLLRHYAREMSWRALVALALIAFFFCFGVTNSVIKLCGRDVSSVDFPAGPVVGALGAVALLIAGAVLKRMPPP